MAKTPELFETISNEYRAITPIGEGGAGRVFEVQGSDGKTFALKCLHPELATTAKRKRFKNEINFCSKNEHPNIVKIIDYGLTKWNDKSTLFYVMRRYKGTLRNIMDSKIDPGSVLRIFDQILSGVEAAHSLGVIHRDIKPENILHDESKDIFVVADFGIAHFEEDMLQTAIETKKADKLLNVSYSAPEQRIKGGTVGKAADIYALGLILNEMYTGQIPEGAGHKTVGEVAPNLSYLDQLIERMRQQDPEARPRNIDEIKKELISRGNEYIALQKLDAKRKEVIPAFTPGKIGDINIIEANWNAGTLTLKLNRKIEDDWIDLFRSGTYGASYLIGLHPVTYQFNQTGSTTLVRVPADERYAQNAIDQFKTWAPLVTRHLERGRAERAREEKRALEERLRQEIAAEEKRIQVTKNLKF